MNMNEAAIVNTGGFEETRGAQEEPVGSGTAALAALPTIGLRC
jgi:hypothetical protein